MVRYARTKDGVYQILRETQISEDIIRYDVKPNKKLEYHIFNENIIKESDKLEDLIDKYVLRLDLVQGNKQEPVIGAVANIKKYPDLMKIYYGAIYTNIGLIYVAKMNAEGEWEIL